MILEISGKLGSSFPKSFILSCHRLVVKPTFQPASPISFLKTAIHYYD
jgi:hypothetical protein